MITFLVCVAILVLGYFTYGTIVDRIVGPDDKIPTPAVRLADGVDYQVLPWWKVLLTQFLNIAGLGPIFGAILGAMFGPVAFLWITFGTLFIGGVHDILSGYVSLKHDGMSIAELVGYYLGKNARNIMRLFSFVLLMLVGVVFTLAPADWLQSRVPLADFYGHSSFWWMLILMGYFILATILPINALISKIFPILSGSMIFMAVLLLIGLFIGVANGTTQMVEFTWNFPHADGLNIFPFLFVTIACGAVSGFHATKSPMMARCMSKETESKRVFYGAMVIEGVVALVWAAAAMAVVGDRFLIGQGVGTMGGAGGVVNYLSDYLLGNWGIVLVVIAIFIVPVTSADTTFRSLRLLIADAFKIEQSSLKMRCIISFPIFALAFIISFLDFQVLWRYFAWSNQTLAAMALWTGAAWLATNKKFHWIASVPAAFMSFISISYIFQAPEGFTLPATISNIVGIAVAIVLFAFFIFMPHKQKISTEPFSN
ncbi:MAG: carbon starvation protein A [Defluviitaleaceae bacterium]|nr:carbon starvation protein A [Defluviitaleaceae bacterium]